MAANQQGKYEQKIAERNAEMEERARRDAISRGETEQIRHYRKLAQAMGEARVKNSAAGLDVSFGSAADLESDIALIGYEDSATIAENTHKEVQGYDINAANYRSEGKAARMRGKSARTASYFNAASTLLGGASQIAGAPKKSNTSSSSSSSSWVGPRD
jgi:hypothetical protein